MMDVLTPEWAVWVLAAYLLGGIPFGLLFTKALSNKDPREHGSGNIGATNALRTGGKTVGILTLVADIAKGSVPVALAIWLVPGDEWLQVSVALAAFIGHIFPVYLRFKGGKGVATMFGVLLPWLPLLGLLAFAVWLLIFFATRYVALASIAAAAMIPLLVFFTHAGGTPTWWASWVLALLVLIRHQGNIQRLLRHEEPKTGGKKND